MSEKVARPATMNPVLKWLLIGGATLIAIIVVLGIVGSQTPDRPLAERVKESCDAQFPTDPEASLNCQLALVTKAVEDDRANKLSQAARDAGMRAN